MNALKLFLLALLAIGCQKVEEEALDLDQMALNEEEVAAQHLAGEPMSSPQEILIKESTSMEETQDSL